MTSERSRELAEQIEKITGHGASYYVELIAADQAALVAETLNRLRNQDGWKIPSEVSEMVLYTAKRITEECVAYLDQIGKASVVDRDGRTIREHILALAPSIAEAPRPEMAQEYGQDHPWPSFDEWHRDHHEIGKIAWPCTHVMRCFWRWTRKAGVTLDQNGVVSAEAQAKREAQLRLEGKLCSLGDVISVMEAEGKAEHKAVLDWLRRYNSDLQVEMERLAAGVHE